MGAGCGSACLPFGVSAGSGLSGSLCYFADVSKIGQDIATCSAFYPLFCFACGVLCLNVALFRVFRGFLGGFMEVVGVCVVLCALRGLCGFCAREWLGGYMACCVFCLSFSLFVTVFVSLLLLFVLCPSLLWLSLLVLLSCLSFLALCLLLLFPFRYIRKKKGRNFLRPLLSCCGFISLVPCALLLAS